MKSTRSLMTLVLVTVVCFCNTTTVSAQTYTSIASTDWNNVDTWLANANLTGTITTSTANGNVTGSGTAFLTQLVAGAKLTTTGGTVIGTIQTVNSNTSITLTGNAASTNSGIAYRARKIPLATNDVIIAGHSVTLNSANAAALSVTLQSGSTITVSSTFQLSVTNNITFDNSTTTTSSATLAGAGTINCGSLIINPNDYNGNSGPFTGTLTSTVTALNVTGVGGVTISSWRNNQNTRRIDGVFNINSGTVTVSTGSISTDNENGANTATLSLANAPQTGTLVLGATAPFSLSGLGTNTITLNGTSTLVQYSRLTGGQAVLGTTYTSLTLSNTSGTNTPDNDVTVNGTLVTTAGGTLNMGTGNVLGGTLTTITNNGTISTSVPTATSAAPIAAGKTWGGTITYAAAAGSQTVVAGTYNGLTVSNTSGTNAVGGNLTATTLTTTAGGTLNMGTSTLAVTNVTNAGIIRTQNTGATPISSGKTWGGTVQFDGAGQSVPSGTYAILALAGSGTKTFGAGLTITDLTITSGVVANLNSFTSSANTLALNSVGQNAGSHGGTGSGATFINTTYFSANAGIINVATASCTAGTWLGNTSTDWFTATNWCGNTLPTSSTNVVISSTTPNQPTIGSSGAVCNNMTIGSGATLTITGTNILTVSGSWTRTGTFIANSSIVDFAGSGAASIGVSNFNDITFSGAGTKTATGILTIAGNVTISNNFTAGAFTHTVAGDWTNNGTFGGTGSTINFNGNNALQTISGSSTTTFNLLTVTKTSQANTLEVTSGFGLATGGLTLTSGTFKISGASTISNTFFSAAGYTIPAAAGFWLNNANATVTAQGGSPILSGLLRVSAGTYNIGTGTGNTISYNSGASVNISGGAINIAGRFCPATAGSSTVTYNQSGGTFTVITQGSTSGTLAGFDIGATGSSFTMSNGTIVIQRATSFTSDYLNLASTTSVTGGSLQLGNASTTGSPVLRTRSSAPVYNLTVNATGTPTVQLVTNGLTVLNDLTIATGTTLNANNQNITVGHDWINNGTFTPGSSTVTFNAATGNQTITKTGGETFSGLTINKSTSGNVVINNNVTVTGTLTLTNGGLTIGSNTLTLNGAVSRTSGNLIGSNNSNLTIGGIAGSLFFDGTGTNNYLKNFTLNTASSATLGNAVNITAYDGTSSEGVLTVNGTGVLTTGGFLTIKSDANGTARIAAGNTAGGYISGQVSVERYIPQNSNKAWRLLASTTSGQTINAAWQEGQANAMNNPNPGFGTKITAGAAVTTNLATAQSAGFDTLSTGVSLFRYNAATDALVQVTATNTGNIASEQGYFLFIRGDRAPGQFGAGAPTAATILRSKGTLFLGNQTAVATGASNYGLVRNPYPSRIDMRNIVRGSNLIDAYQVWDAKLGGTYGVGGFQTFSKSGANYVVSPGGGSYGANGSVQNFIESGAAFFIQSTTNTNNTAQVTEACKASSSSNNSYRPSGVLADDKRIAFTLYAINPGSTDVVDGGLVFFNDTYSNSVTVEDVRKSGNFNENFGMLRDNTELVVEKRKDVQANDSIFFKMYQLRQISYRIDVEGLNFEPGVTTAVLQDRFTNTNTPLDLSTLTQYTFTVNATAGSFAQDRFRIVLSSGNTFSGTGNWTDNARWSRGVPPVSAEAVTIAAGANATLNTDYTVGASLTMTATSTLVINPARTLSVSGTADFAGQSVTFRSDNTGYGSLGQVTGTLNGATNVTVERYIPNNGFRSWRLLSVPTYGNGQTIRQAWQEGNANPLPLQNNLPNYGTQITGVFATQAAATAAGFDSTSVQAGMLTWNGTGWNNVTSTNSPIANNKAYFLFVRGERSKGVAGAVSNSSATTLRTNGTVYTGNQVFNVPTNGFAVVANSYPSAISFTGLTRSNVNNIFYVWDSKKQNGNSLGVYQTFSGINSFNCLISGGSYVLGQPNTTIESGQAFFVTGGVTAGGGTITLLESAKVSGTSGNLGFRPSSVLSKIDSRLLDRNNDVLDANAIVFDKVYSNEVNADDAVKFGNPGANFAIEKNSKILAIEGAQPVTENDIIQFRMWNLQQQDYKLEFTACNMNIQGLYAVVEDKYLNTSKEIDLKGTGVLSFTVDANPASAAANRFRIVFSKTKPVAGTIEQAITIAPNPVEGKTVNLLFRNQPAGNYSIRILTTEGKLLASKMINFAGGNSSQVFILPPGVTTGSYQVEIIAPGQSKMIKQLIIKNTR